MPDLFRKNPSTANRSVRRPTQAGKLFGGNKPVTFDQGVPSSITRSGGRGSGLGNVFSNIQSATNRANQETLADRQQVLTGIEDYRRQIGQDSDTAIQQIRARISGEIGAVLQQAQEQYANMGVAPNPFVMAQLSARLRAQGQDQMTRARLGISAQRDQQQQFALQMLNNVMQATNRQTASPGDVLGLASSLGAGQAAGRALGGGGAGRTGGFLGGGNVRRLGGGARAFNRQTAAPLAAVRRAQAGTTGNFAEALRGASASAGARKAAEIAQRDAFEEPAFLRQERFKLRQAQAAVAATRRR